MPIKMDPYVGFKDGIAGSVPEERGRLSSPETLVGSAFEPANEDMVEIGGARLYQLEMAPSNL